MADFPFRNEPGYVGAFTRESAPGALPPGSRIVKTASEAGDAMPDGAPGVVLGSFGDGHAFERPDLRGADFLYFVEWDARPGYAVATSNRKIAAAQDREKP